MMNWFWLEIHPDLGIVRVRLRRRRPRCRQLRHNAWWNERLSRPLDDRASLPDSEIFIILGGLQMTTTRLSVLAPSGRIVDVTAGEDAAVLGINTSFLLTNGKGSRVFMTGSRGYHERACQVMVTAKPVWRGSISGREIVASASDDNSVLVASLIGDYHELLTVFANGRPAEESVVSVFAALRVEDSPAGMTVAARQGAFSSIAWQDVSVIVEGRGALNIPDPDMAQKMIPSWRGAPTQHGEIWRTPGDEEESRRGGDERRGAAFLLGCPRGVAEVHVPERHAGAADELAAWLDCLDVSWR